MTKIKRYVEQIAEELEGAKEYAEKYLWYKSKDDTMRAGKYKEMATQELQHALNIHDIAMQDIEQLKKVYPTVPNSMMKKWEDSHANYVERTAFVKQMLAM